MHIWGWMLPPELEWLMEQAARCDEGIVEVGSLHGRSAFAMLTATDGPVYCVDSWSDEADQSYDSFMGNCGHFPNLIPVRAFSPQAAELVPDAVDMTFLDGSHVYDAVLADIAAWLPKTRRIICGHDFDRAKDAGFPGVAEAVDEVFGRDRVNTHESIWWVDLEADRSINPKLRGVTRSVTFLDEYGRWMDLAYEWPA